MPGAGPQVCKNVTVYLPDRSPGHSAYIRREYRTMSPPQLQQKLLGEGYHRVLQVDEQPPQLLWLADFSDRAEDVEDVELRDGMQLAVVVNEGASTIKQQVATLSSWQQGQIAGDEFTSTSWEWAKARIAGDKGVYRWYDRVMAGLVEGLKVAIEVDGLAYSARRVLLVERMPRIALEHVEELVAQKRSLEKLVEYGAPNTAMLRDPATGRIKPLEVYLMADGWVDDPEEVAACAYLMEKYRIEPVLPTGDTFTVRWPPPDDCARQRGQAFLTKLEGRRQSGGVGSDASTGTAAGGGATGPNSTRDISHRASQAACISAPARYLRAHPHGTAAWVQRHVALVCRPTHLPRQHATSGPRVHRL